MDKSSNADSSNIQEEKIAGINLYGDEVMTVRKKNRFANISEIITFEKLSQIHNKKLMESNSALFTHQDINQQNLHLLDSKDGQYLMIDGKKETIQDMIMKEEKKWQININVTNVCRSTLLYLEIDQFKRNHTFTIETQQMERNKTIGFKYTFTMVEGSLALKVWVELDEVYKIWKEMEVPILQNPIILQINQISNEQTSVKINDFLFQLILKMPFYQEAHYHLIYQTPVNISKIQFQSKAEEKYFEDSETNCSNQCKLI